MRRTGGRRRALTMGVLITAACSKQDPPPPPAPPRPAPIASATATARASAVASSAPPPSASAAAAPELPGYLCQPDAIWIPSGVKLGPTGCPVHGTKDAASFPPYPVRKAACDPIAPGASCTDLTFARGLLYVRVDASQPEPRAVVVHRCERRDLVLTIDLDGKVQHAVSVPAPSADEGGRCDLQLVSVDRGHLAVAVHHFPEGFSYRTGSPGVSAFGGALEGPMQPLGEPDGEGHVTGLAARSGYLFGLYQGVQGAAWGKPPVPMRFKGDTMSLSRFVLAGETVFRGDHETLEAARFDAPEVVSLAKGTLIDGIAADEGHVALLVRDRATKQTALLAAPVPDAPAKIAPRRYATPSSTLHVVGCGHALLEKDRVLELVRLSDGASARLTTANGRRGNPTITCAEVVFDSPYALDRVPFAAFGPLKPPSSPPASVDIAHPFADADAGAATEDAGSVGAGAGAAVDAGAASGGVDGGKVMVDGG